MVTSDTVVTVSAQVDAEMISPAVTMFHRLPMNQLIVFGWFQILVLKHNLEQLIGHSHAGDLILFHFSIAQNPLVKRLIDSLEIS